MTSKAWLRSNTFHHSKFSDLSALVARKQETHKRISVGIPTLNEEETIGTEVCVIREALMERFPLIDEIAVIDSGSTDATESAALRAGARFYPAATILPQYGDNRGKGENLWKSLEVLEGDIIVWLDADIKNIAPKFVYGLVGPLLMTEGISYVKGFYNRPLRDRDGLRHGGGGRVSEILMRPLLSLYFPELAYIMQPLSGEYAGKRSLLETLSFSIGYGVEIGLLLELYNRIGLAGMAQVDLDMRIHRNRSLHELGQMAFAILQTFFRYAEKSGKLQLQEKLGSELLQFHALGDDYIPYLFTSNEFVRPPICTLAEYRDKGKF
jgi:glucosyl-3-phosphoglycerate synthase